MKKLGPLGALRGHVEHERSPETAELIKVVIAVLKDANSSLFT
jgi:hypothetical protein